MQCVHGPIGVLQIFLVVITPICKSFHMVFSVILYVICYADAQRYGDIRLVGGSYQWEGRVEIFISGTWGTITDSDWTNNDAQVVCRKMGHFKPGTESTQIMHGYNNCICRCFLSSSIYSLEVYQTT